MPFSLFVYYNEMVHNSKTTKDTTSAQENFFFVLKRPIKWYQHQVSISWSDFVKSDLATNSAAQGGPEDGHRQKMIGINRGHAHLNSCEEKSRFFQDVFEILQIC